MNTATRRAASASASMTHDPPEPLTACELSRFGLARGFKFSLRRSLNLDRIAVLILWHWGRRGGEPRTRLKVPRQALGNAAGHEPEQP